MVKRIEFDELGNLTAVEFYDGTTSGQAMADIEHIRLRMNVINKHYPTAAAQIETELVKVDNPK